MQATSEGHSFDWETMDVSHTINHISFGPFLRQEVLTERTVKHWSNTGQTLVDAMNGCILRSQHRLQSFDVSDDDTRQ